MKSIKAGIDVKRMTTEAESFNSGNFAWGYYNPAEQGFDPGESLHQGVELQHCHAVLRRRLRDSGPVLLFVQPAGASSR